MSVKVIYKKGECYYIGNDQSIIDAGFSPVKSYYNRAGSRLRYFVDDSGMVISKITCGKRKPIINFYENKKQANDHFKQMSASKWIQEKEAPKWL